MAIRTPEAILLTGAGFTHNFGGYLANDMWAEIFNHKAVQRHRCLREEMYSPADLFDFEDVYDRVLHGTFSNEEKDSMVEAVVSVYGDLDKIIREFWQTSYSISLNSLAQFIERFADTPRNPGYFFTLNQDLFVERCLPFERVLALPGLKRGDRFNTRFKDLPLKSIQIRLPESVAQAESQYAKEAGDLVYVKLHGSMEWLSHDDSLRPVVGTQKTQILEREPLLRWYGELFCRALTARPNRKLVVIGYGFRDRHINDTIAEACNNNELNVYVVGPENATDFYHRLHALGIWEKISKGWAGYYRWTLRDLFLPSDATGPGKIALRNLVQAVFETQ